MRLPQIQTSRSEDPTRMAQVCKETLGHSMLVDARPTWSLVSELQRQVLAKISPTFGGCPQSQHGHQDLAATLSIERQRIKPSRSKGR